MEDYDSEENFNKESAHEQSNRPPRNTSNKWQEDFEERQQARNRLIDTVRAYGMVLLGALVLLPPPLVAFGAVCAIIVYFFMKYVWRGSRVGIPAATVG